MIFIFTKHILHNNWIKSRTKFQRYKHLIEYKPPVYGILILLKGRRQQLIIRSFGQEKWISPTKPPTEVSTKRMIKVSTKRSRSSTKAPIIKTTKRAIKIATTKTTKASTKVSVKTTKGVVKRTTNAPRKTTTKGSSNNYWFLSLLILPVITLLYLFYRSSKKYKKEKDVRREDVRHIYLNPTYDIEMDVIHL